MKKTTVPSSTTAIPGEIKPVPSPVFTISEAKTLVALVRSAPTANMDDADRRRALLERFVRWYEFVSK